MYTTSLNRSHDCCGQQLPASTCVFCTVNHCRYHTILGSLINFTRNSFMEINPHRKFTQRQASYNPTATLVRGLSRSEHSSRKAACVCLNREIVGDDQTGWLVITASIGQHMVICAYPAMSVRACVVTTSVTCYGVSKMQEGVLRLQTLSPIGRVQRVMIGVFALQIATATKHALSVNHSSCVSTRLYC